MNQINCNIVFEYMFSVRLLPTAILLLFLGCKAPPPSPVTYSGGDGSSHQQAVVIEGACDETVGIAAEKAWLRQKYPSYYMTMQSLQNLDNRHYDVIEFKMTDGQSNKIYFDITDFFGKF